MVRNPAEQIGKRFVRRQILEFIKMASPRGFEPLLSP